MRHTTRRARRLAAGLLGVCLAAGLATACSSSDDAKPSKPAATHSAQQDAEKAAGIPPKPTGADRDAYLDAISKVDPTLAAEPDQAIDHGRNQCSALDNGGSGADHFAALRFGNDAHPLTDDQGAELNKALRKTLCPEK